MKRKLVNTPAEAYELGYRLGEVRGTYEATAATPAEARDRDRLGLSMINAVHAAAIGNDAGDYELHGAWAEGINAGRASQLNEAAREYGHEAARA
jgi:hypothetical protein